MKPIVQKAFTDFHETIKLTWNEEGALLREKRDIVLKKLRERLKKRFEEQGEAVPTFSHRNQGSYAMRTGVKPLDGDYDIDVAVLFNISVADHPDPTKVKAWVRDALEGHTARPTQIRRPCVTVWYQQQGEVVYHLDLAIYSNAASNDDGTTRLAKGFPGSAAENKEWAESDPDALVTAMNDRNKGEDRNQYRRVITYLKRWKDIHFSSSGEAAPRGIALTSAAYKWFTPAFEVVDAFSGKRDYDDLGATRALVATMLSSFCYVYNENEWAWRISASLPVPPGEDPFLRMSNKQMADFRSKLSRLLNALDSATAEVDPVEACKTLKKQFGDDFHIPDPDSTAKKVPAAILSSNMSA